MPLTPMHLASRSERQVGAFESRLEHLIGSRRELYDSWAQSIVTDRSEV